MDELAKVALITGASQGIGAALAVRFAAKGYRLVLAGRTIEEKADDDVLAVRADVRDAASCRYLVELAVERFGRLDTLVNNAGIFIGKQFIDYSAEDFDAVMATNVAGYFHLTQAGVRHMLTQGHGHVLAITTSLVDQPMAHVPTALAGLSKGGINAATRALAIEYAKSGLRFNAVSPGIIATPMHEDSDHAFLAGLHPMGRMGSVEEIAQAALFLEDAGFVTGEVLHVDGGAHAGRW